MVTSTDPLKRPRIEFDPDEYRMSLGEHLEELRRRFVYALIVFAAVLLVFLVPAVGVKVMAFFCTPLYEALNAQGLNTQVHEKKVGEAFMVYLQIGLISAAAVTAPWTLFQLWQFVAAGLYPHERKAITKYIPLSIGLLVGGMVFVYTIVLPWTLSALIGFAMSVPRPDLKPGPADGGGRSAATTPEATFVQSRADDPAEPGEGRIWFNSAEQRLKLRLAGRTRAIALGAENLLAADYGLSDYVAMVLGMLVMFGLSFQLPLIVLALARVGVVELEAFQKGRKYVYFALVIAAAVITPGADLASLVALAVPLVLLYELGILLARVGGGKADRVIGSTGA